MKNWRAILSVLLALLGVVCVWLGQYDQATANYALAILVHLWSKEAA